MALAVEAIAPRHVRRQRQLDRALVTLAAANERLAKHHGSAPLRALAKSEMGHTRCMKKTCAEQPGQAQYIAQGEASCPRCGEANATNPEARDEAKWQRCKTAGTLPWWADGSTSGKGTAKAKGKCKERSKGKSGSKGFRSNQTWTDAPTKGNGKGKGKGDLTGNGKGNWLTAATWKDRENEKI